jgi:DNA-binding SARP family transcriptional activator
MLVRVLGNVEVVVDERVVDLGGLKPRALFSALVAADGRAVSVERLIDLLWGDEPPAKVMASLQAYVANLRRTLEPGRPPRQPARILVTRPPGYALLLADQDLDARRFVELVAEAGDTLDDPVRAEAKLEEALGLWRGEAYGGVSTTSTALGAEAARLEEMRLDAVEGLWASRLRLGESAGAVGELERLVALHPFRERCWRLLALALYRSGRQGDALAALHRARSHLAEELGIDPGTELRELEVAMLRQDPALEDAGPARPAADVPTPTAEIVGRQREIGLAHGALDAARDGEGRLLLVTGGPGIGKTSLARSIAAEAAARGFRVGRGAWDADEAPPLSGWQLALGEALGSAEVLHLPAPDQTDVASTTYRLGGAVLAALRSAGPTLLVLDDVHWADSDSLRLLRRCTSSIATLPLVLVVTTRDSAADIGPTLSDTLAWFARSDPVRLPLAGLDLRGVADQVRQQTGVAVGVDVAAAIRDRTEGNPFFVAEFVRLLVEDGTLGDPSANSWATVPEGVRDVVRERLAQLSSGQRDVLVTAAVLGRSVDLDVLEEATARSGDEVDEAIETGLVTGVLDDDGPGRFRFTHAIVRDAVYELLPATGRRRAHAAAGQALERRRFGRTAEHAAELAEHYRLAGPAHARAAWSFARRAAELAIERSAPVEAARLYAAAAEAVQADDSASPEERESVRSGLGRALCRAARPMDAWAHLAAAGESALDRGDPASAARILLGITEQAVWTWRTHPLVDDRAIETWQAVLAALPEDEPLLRARVQAALAVELLYRPGAADHASRLVDDAVLAARRGNAPPELLQILRLAHLALQRPDLLDRRIAIGDEMVALAARADAGVELAAALCMRATDRSESGRWSEANDDMSRAQQLAARHQVAPMLVITGWALSLTRQAVGDFEGSESAIAEIEDLQATISMAGVGIGLCQLATMRLLQGRLAELEPALAEAAAQHPNFRDLHALALIHAGRLEEARVAVGAWAEQPPLLWDFLWTGLTVVRARLWMAFGDQEAITDLRTQLEPYADRLVVGGMSAMFLGSVHHTVGELALAAGDRDAAVQHLEAAVATHRRLGFTAMVSASESALAGAVRLGQTTP